MRNLPVVGLPYAGTAAGGGNAAGASGRGVYADIDAVAQVAGSVYGPSAELSEMVRACVRRQAGRRIIRRQPSARPFVERSGNWRPTRDGFSCRKEIW